MTNRAKRNPWRNTRNDFQMPWHRILGRIFMILLPIAIILIGNNIVVRSGTFYSYYTSKTTVVREIPYDIESEDLVKTFSEFMNHGKAAFTLKENSEYKPQQVFNNLDKKVMKKIRSVFDITLIAGIVMAVIVTAIAIYLCRKKEKKMLYQKYRTTLPIFGILLLVWGTINFVPTIRESLFKKAFGAKFPPGDVLVQLFEGELLDYYAAFQLIVTLTLMGTVYYIMARFVGEHRMFIRNR